METELASAPSERVIEYHFRCFCGASIIATEKIVTCERCGANLGIRRVKRNRRRRSVLALRPSRSPHGDDIRELVILTLLYILLGYYLYDLGVSIRDMINN